MGLLRVLRNALGHQPKIATRARVAACATALVGWTCGGVDVLWWGWGNVPVSVSLLLTIADNLLPASVQEYHRQIACDTRFPAGRRFLQHANPVIENA